MTPLSDAVAAIEAENISLKAEVKSQAAQIERQAGAIAEGRAERERSYREWAEERASLRKEISRLLTAFNALEAFTRNNGHAVADLKLQVNNAGESFPSRAPTGSAGGQQLSRPAPDINSPEVVSLIKARAQAAIRKMGGAA